MKTNPYICNHQDSVLVVIDIQTKLTSAMPLKVLARLQRNSGLLLTAAKALDIPVIATEQYPQGLGPIEPDITKLLSDNTAVIEKTCFSCATHQGFMEALQETGRKQVILVGMEAHICILQTAMDLAHQDYSVFAVTDAICSRQRENYETALNRMAAAGINIADAESVAFEWLADSSHEHFKLIASMVK